MNAYYRDGPNISAQIVPSSESDSDDILILDVVQTGENLASATSSTNVATVEVPSTSRGIAVPNVNDVDVEIVDVVKPRHLRTPDIVNLTSDDENDSKNVVKNEDAKIHNFTIEIIDSEDEIPALNPPSPDLGNAASGANRWSTSSEDEMLGRRRNKGKGKGIGKRSKQKSSTDDVLTSSAGRSSHVTSSATPTMDIMSPTGSTEEGSLRVSSASQPRWVASSLGTTSSSSSAVIEAEERLLEAWRSRMAARSR